MSRIRLDPAIVSEIEKEEQASRALEERGSPIKANGLVNFVPLEEDPTDDVSAGDVYFNVVSERLRLYTGTKWVDV